MNIYKKDLIRYLKLILITGKWRIIPPLLLMMLVMVIGIFLPILIQNLIDNGIVGMNIALLIRVTLIYILLILLSKIANIYITVYFESLKLKVSTSLKQSLIERLSKAKGEYISNQKTGDILHILDNDIFQVENFGIELIFDLIMNVITAVIVFLILAKMNIYLLFAVFIIQSGLLFLQLGISPKITEKIKKIRDTVGQIANLQEQFISNIKTAILTNVIQEFVNLFLKTQEEFVKESKATNMLITFQREGTGFLQGLNTIIAYAIGGFLIISNKLSLGELTAFIQYTALLFAPCVVIANYNIQIRQAAVALGKIYNAMDSINIINESQTKWPDNIKISKIEFDKVCFSYTKHQVLSQFSITLKRGKIVALVGESGCGKSTILNLLYKLWAPQEGKIYVNDQLLENIETQSIRNKICIVCQEPFIFNTGILENIQMGMNTYNSEQVNNICNVVGISNLINSNKQETGEKGNKLSGGEKQRLSLARSLVKECDVLILDESTSSLDNISQKKIMDSMMPYLQDKIVILIAHRISLTKYADYIVVMENGGIIEEGDANTLIEKRGKFYEMNKLI